MKTKRTLLLSSAALLGFSAVGLLLGRAAAARGLHRDVEQLFAESKAPAGRVYGEAQLVGLPAPVKRYFRRVLRHGQPYLQGLRLRHSGQFKTDLQKDWLPMVGEEYLTARPAGFIWEGSTRQFTARDEYRHGRGLLAVRLLGAVPLMHAQGPDYDQGELLRWLTESVLLPTALLPGDGLAWVDVDDQSARLLAAHQGEEVSCLVRFNAQNEIEECEALRYQGEAGLLPWVGRFADYREWHGVRVPTVLEASWVIDGRRQPYAQFRIEELDYARLEPY